VTIDQIVHLDENLPKEIVVEDRTTTEQIKLIQQLDEDDKKAIFRIISTMPTKNKIYRKAVCQSWLIIYRIKSDEVVIIGVLYASRRASKIRGLKKIK